MQFVLARKHLIGLKLHRMKRELETNTFATLSYRSEKFQGFSRNWTSGLPVQVETMPALTEKMAPQERFLCLQMLKIGW